MMLMQLANFLASLPFLPNGKGALILIFGGLAVLPASLLWSTVSSRGQWATGIEPGAARLGLGRCRVSSADGASCVVLLTACAGCKGRPQRARSCDREANALLDLVLARAPNAKVVEVSCGRPHPGACTFVIQRGRSA